MRPGKETKRTWVFVTVKLAVALTLLSAVIVWLQPSVVFASLRAAAPGAVLLAVVTQVLARLVWTFRWQVILRASQLDRGFWNLLAMLLIGLFFDNFLPTGVGGDLVRGHYAAQGPAGRIASYLAVFLERVLGFITFAGMAFVACLLALIEGSSPLPIELLIAVTLSAGLFFATGAYLLAKPGWIRFMPKLRLPSRVTSEVFRVLELFARPETPKASIITTSIALKLLAVLFFAVCGWAVGLELPLTVYFLVVPASVLAAMIPVTLNGLGIREGTMVALLTLSGAPPADAGAMVLLALAVSMGFSAIGGVIYPFYRATLREASQSAALVSLQRRPT